MSDMNAALGMIAKLQRAAAAGNPRAKAELAKLTAAFAQAQIVGDGEEEEAAEDESVIGEGEEAEMYIQGDQLEQADRLLSGPLRHVDSLTQKAMLRRHRDSAVNLAAPPTNTNPPSAQGALFGNQGTPDSTKNPIELARWTADADIECTNFTVTAALVRAFTNDFALQLTSRGFLLIQWGTRGLAFNIEVDIGQGCELTLTGSNVSVSVFCEPTVQLASTYTTGLPYSVGISFRQGNRTAPLTRTKVLDLLGGSPGEFIIPPFAKRFWVMSQPTSNLTINVREQDSSILASWVQPAGVPPTTPYILPGSIANLDVTPVANSTVTVVFELDV